MAHGEERGGARVQRKAENSIGWVSKTAEEAGRDRGMALVRHDDGQKFLSEYVAIAGGEKDSVHESQGRTGLKKIMLLWRRNT